MLYRVESLIMSRGGDQVVSIWLVVAKTGKLRRQQKKMILTMKFLALTLTLLFCLVSETMGHANCIAPVQPGKG